MDAYWWQSIHCIISSLFALLFAIVVVVPVIPCILCIQTSDNFQIINCKDHKWMLFEQAFTDIAHTYEKWMNFCLSVGDMAESFWHCHKHETSLLISSIKLSILMEQNMHLRTSFLHTPQAERFRWNLIWLISLMANYQNLNIVYILRTCNFSIRMYQNYLKIKISESFYLEFDIFRWRSEI